MHAPFLNPAGRGRWISFWSPFQHPAMLQEGGVGSRTMQAMMWLISIALSLLALGAAAAQRSPITLGMEMALTGGLAGTGKGALLATQSWIGQTQANRWVSGRP